MCSYFAVKTTVGSVIAVIKKTVKVSGSEGGFKTVVLKKKRKGSVLAEGIDIRGTGDTTESESIDMEKECLVEETSVDYGENDVFTEGNSNQMPKSLHIKTKKVLEKPLSVIDYGTVNMNDNVLDDFFLLPPPLPVKPSIQVFVYKSFALDIDFVVVAGKFSQEKVNFVRKIFSGVNGFGGVSTSSKFGGIIWASFTSKKVMMTAAQLANDHGVVVNTNLKHPINNHMNWAIVLKEIPVKTSIEAVYTAISEFGSIKSIKMQLVGFWQKMIIELEDQNQTDLLAAEWSILIEKDVVCVAWADVDKQMWDARDKFRALLYTLPMGTNTHDLWNFIGSVSGKTCFIKRNSVTYVRTCCAIVCFDSEGSLIQVLANTLVIKDDQFHLAKIYEKKSASVSHPLAFGGKTWASMVGKLLPIVPFDGSAQFSSISCGKSLPTFNGELEDRLKNIESSLISLAEQIGELAQRLNSLELVDHMSDIVMGEGSSGIANGKTAPKPDLSASLGVKRLESILAGLSASVISLTAHLDGLSLTGVAPLLSSFQ
ncbi:hypothetical protein G9A89_021447 [Geosiphon pyriformis]|nr:hypothetical protein G9A89_021447 [Geosiphon pyriformis]